MTQDTDNYGPGKGATQNNRRAAVATRAERRAYRKLLRGPYAPPINWLEDPIVGPALSRMLANAVTAGYFESPAGITCSCGRHTRYLYFSQAGWSCIVCTICDFRRAIYQELCPESEPSFPCTEAQ